MCQPVKGTEPQSWEEQEENRDPSGSSNTDATFGPHLPTEPGV